MPLLKIKIQPEWLKLLKLLSVLVMYILAYQFVEDYLAPQGNASMFFVATGIALAALLLGGRLYALSVFFGSMVIHILNGFSLWVAISIATGCTLNAVLGASLVTYKDKFDLSLPSLSDYLRLIILGGILGSSIGALIGTTTLQLAHIIPPERYFSELMFWLIDDVLGVVLITPLILVWYKMPSHLFTYQKVLKTALIIVGTWLVGQTIFLDWFSESLALVAKGYWLFAITTLTAIYLGKHGTLLILLMVAIQAILGSVHGIGFFADDLKQTQLLNVYFYLISLSLVSTALAIYINERDLIELELRESEDTFHRLFEDSNDAVMLAKNGLFIDCNNATLRLLGYANKAELINQRPTKISPIYQSDGRSSEEKAAEMMAIALRDGYHRFDWHHQHVDGSARPVEVTLSKIMLHGEPVIHAALRDISERKRMESALRDSEEQFKSIFNQAPLGIALIDSLTGQICAANSMFVKIVDRTVDEVTHLDWISITHPDDVQKYLDNMALMNAGKTTGFSIEKRYIHPDGSIGWINLTVAPMLVEDKTRPRHHCIIEDITERKQQENAQLFLLECGYKQSGEDFFASLARYLAETLTMDYICIDRLKADGLTVETLAFYVDGHFEENITYDLDIAPCGCVIGNVICCFSENVRDLFPKDDFLHEMRVESYIGTTLWGFDGQPNGLIALMSRKPLKNRQLAEALLKLVAVRASGELERQRAETELRIAATVFESQEGMFITNADCVILKVNQAFTEITGYTAAETIGQTPRLLRSERHDSAFYTALWQSIYDTNVWRGEIWNRRKEGEICPQWLTITAVRANNNNKVTHYVATLIDISEQKATEEKIKQLAFYDALTNLPNRRSLYERMKYSINLAHREGKQMAVLMLDLDKFKPVNDSLGHAVGDQLLQQVAEQIKVRLRDVDMVARLGGDEFVVLLDDISQPTDIEHVARDIIATLNQPFMLQNNCVQIGVSIGISLYPQHGDNPEILIENADAALYFAKKRGRGCFAYFSNELTQVAHERIALETRLRQAVEHQELRVYYQPQIDIATGRIIGAEALVRWQDPTVGLIFPDDFMPIAETSNLFLLIGSWVLTEACKQGQQWLNAGFPSLTLTVNVSPQQFRRSDINNLMATVLAETGFPATQLELEISEAALMAHQDQALAILTDLNNQSIQLAIDNFGTGYSSFAVLKYFPLTVLKIDKSFIKDIPLLSNDMIITSTIINMAHNLGFKVLAKGVETPEQLAFLQRQGCDSYQGFFYSPAITAEAFVELLRKQMV
ncbi:MAG: EAL domain-containing protein [Methylococcaceae bacterium]|nr:EAL domain-containing protein [Methylococcaceae bacterium]